MQKSDDVQPSTSRELVDTVKPETKTTKRYKAQSNLETKMIEYLDKGSDNVVQKEEDMVSLQMQAIEHMIRESVPKHKHLSILFSIVHQVQKYIDDLDQTSLLHACPPPPPAYSSTTENQYATLQSVNMETLKEIPFSEY